MPFQSNGLNIYLGDGGGHKFYSLYVFQILFFKDLIFRFYRTVWDLLEEYCLICRGNIKLMLLIEKGLKLPFDPLIIKSFFDKTVQNHDFTDQYTQFRKIFLWVFKNNYSTRMLSFIIRQVVTDFYNDTIRAEDSIVLIKILLAKTVIVRNLPINQIMRQVGSIQSQMLIIGMINRNP